jgi:hypothetical protein
MTDELVGRDVDARIFQLEEFSALTDRWATAYYIRVPSEHAPAAAAWIRAQMADDAATAVDNEQVGFRFATMDEAIDPEFWRPIALVVLAGVASFVLGQHFSDQPGRRPPNRNSLSTAVDRIGRPLVTELIPGQPRHRLVYDRRREAWCLDTDWNSDGAYDRRRQFHASGAAW